MRHLVSTSLIVIMVGYMLPSFSYAYEREVDRASYKYGIEKALIKAIILQESSGDKYAKRYEAKLHRTTFKGKPSSWATSYGLTQVIFGWHKKKCRLITSRQLYNPRISIDCGMRVFKQCLNRTNSIYKALGCYNGDRTGRYANSVLKKYKRILSR